MSTPAHEIAPIPGDPAGIRSKATKFTRMAEAITESIALLEAVVREAETQDSEAVDALAGAVGNTRERLRDLHDRYEVAGSQLTTFADVLETAQRQAQSAVTARDQAQSDVRRLEYRLADARDAVNSTVDPAERTEAARYAAGYSQSLQFAQADLTAAGTSHAAALQSVREAGNAAADAIARTIGDDGVNDSLWDRVSGAAKDWISANAEWLSVVKNILGAITAIVGLVSIVFPVLAPIALGLAAATAVLSFALASAGEGSWLEFGLDMLGVLTFGVGAVAAKGVGLALKGTQVLRGLTYNRQATSLMHRIISPIATRRSAIAAVGDEFQRLLPAGQQLMTRMPQTTFAQRFTHEWLELSGRQVEQFRTILPQAQLGAGGIRAAFVEGMGEATASVYRGAATLGTVMDGAGIATLGLDLRAAAESTSHIPGLDDLAGGWSTVKEATTVPAGTSWQTHGMPR
ncbi:hypothetical protein ACFVR6_01395 [Microbacterium sp. NPDC058021]|uniref:hypothetical protein n=1 Tax=Microbacterium sp. NPDC058021 TaxID=3346306 RepID=UPI0036DF7B9B